MTISKLVFSLTKGKKKVTKNHNYFLSTAIRWNDMPRYCPCGFTCWRRLREWDSDGTWKKIQEELLADEAVAQSS